MKAIKNKRRFDPRQFLDERREETKEEIEIIKENFNNFSLDNWLEEESVKEIQVGDGPSGGYSTSAPPPATGPVTVKIRSQKDQDRELEKVKDREISREKLTTDTGAVKEVCGAPEMGPEEAEPAVTDLSPDDAFSVGYSAAVEEILASVEGLLDDPMGMGPAPGEEEEGAVDISAIFEDDEDDKEEERRNSALQHADAARKRGVSGEETMASLRKQGVVKDISPGLKNPVKDLSLEGASDPKPEVGELEQEVAGDHKKTHFYVKTRGELRSVLKKVDPKYADIHGRSLAGLQSFANGLESQGAPYATNLSGESDLEES